MRLGRGEGQSLDLVQLAIVAFQLHQLLMCPTLDQAPIPEAPVQPYIRQRTSRAGGAGRAGEERGCGKRGAKIPVVSTYRITSACFTKWPNRCVMKIRVRPSRSRRRERMPDEMMTMISSAKRTPS